MTETYLQLIKEHPHCFNTSKRTVLMQDKGQQVEKKETKKPSQGKHKG